MSLQNTLNALNFGAIASYFIGSKPSEISANSFLSNLASATSCRADEEPASSGTSSLFSSKNFTEMSEAYARQATSLSNSAADRFARAGRLALFADAEAIKANIAETPDQASQHQATASYLDREAKICAQQGNSLSQQAKNHQDTSNKYKYFAASPDPYESKPKNNDYQPDNNSGSYTKPNGEYQGK